MDDLISCIQSHEGLILYCYADSLGFLTIGYGRCIDKKNNTGITKEEAEYLLKNDVNKSLNELKNYIWFNALDEVRQGVLIELHFNIGLTKLLQFRNMISALEKKDFSLAAIHLLNSKWAKEVGITRSQNMENRLINGFY